MSTVHDEPWDAGVRVQLQLDQVYVRRRTRYQSLLIGHNESYGRTLFLNGMVQSAEADEALYHEAFVHPPMILHGAARRVLVGGAGEGATLRELLRHPQVEEIVAVDLDAEVVEACRRHLPGWSEGAFDDPRVTLKIEDVQQTLADPSGRRFDVALMDLSEPVQDGPAADLFTARFFSAVARRLRGDGILVLQSGGIDVRCLEGARTVVSTLRSVFPWVYMLTLYVPSFHNLWSITLAARRPLKWDPADLEARVGRLPAAELKFYTPQTHRALFATPPWLRRGLAEPGRVLTGEDEARWLVSGAEG